MSKKTWCTWAITGVFGLAVAGAGVASNSPPEQAARQVRTPGARPTRAADRNASTDVNKLLKAYGIVRLPADKPAEIPAGTNAPSANDSDATAVATDRVATENDAGQEITRLPSVQQVAGARPSDAASMADRTAASAAPVEPSAGIATAAESHSATAATFEHQQQGSNQDEPFNSNIVRTGRFVPSEATAERRTHDAPSNATSSGRSELSIYSQRQARLATEAALRSSAERDEAAAEAAPASAPRNNPEPDYVVQGQIVRRELASTALPTLAPRRFAEEGVTSVRPYVSRPEPELAAPRVAAHAEPDRTEAASRDKVEPLSAPAPQHYAPAAHATQQADEAATLSIQPQNRSLRPDDVARAITSKRELLMVDEARFTEAAIGNPLEAQHGSNASLARYRVEDQVASPAYQGAEDIVFPPGGPNLAYAGSCGHDCGWLWVFGTETTMLFTDRDGVDAEVEIATPVDRFSATAEDEFGVGPRIWFGARNCRWEILGRFWALGDIGDEADPLKIGTLDTRSIYSGSDVEALTADVELIRHFCCGPCWDIYGGVGFRYASLEQTARVTGTATDGAALPGFVYADAIGYNEIEGPGLSVLFGGSRLLHCYCCSSLNAFWSVRGSMIWGDMNSAAQTTLMATDPNSVLPAFAGRVDAAYAESDGDLMIGEVQLGLRWCHPLQCIPAVASVHIAFEGQWWDADGGVAQTEGLAFANNNAGVARASSGPNAEVSLIGLNIGCGLTW